MYVDPLNSHDESLERVDACSAPADNASTMNADAAPRPWFVYLVRAANGALYCGISDDAQRRFAAHQRGRGARFFHSSPAVALVYVEACASKGDALRRERAIKRLRKPAKEALLGQLMQPLPGDAVNRPNG